MLGRGSSRDNGEGRRGGVLNGIGGGGFGRGLSNGQNSGLGGKGGGIFGSGNTPPQKILSTAVEGIATGIGLVAERRKSKQKRLESDDREQSSTNDTQRHASPLDDLETQWILDDAQRQVGAETGYGHQVRDEHQNMRSNTDFEGFPPAYDESYATGRLRWPVLLPQRRPTDRSRGFIRAYAPTLEACGISQHEWLQFLDNFEKSHQTSSWIMALNLASIATMALPTITSFAVSAAVQVATVIASETQTRYKTNQFLDRANKLFFLPRGLYCMVLTWNPESDQIEQPSDMAGTVANAMNNTSKLKSSHGKTFGEGMFPEVAPLVFPELDQLQDQASSQAVGTKQKLKREQAFVNDYLDRRGRAKYAAENPDSILATCAPAPEFASRYADPSHKASSGDLISFVTAGKLSSGGGVQKLLGKVAGQGRTTGDDGQPATQSSFGGRGQAHGTSSSKGRGGGLGGGIGGGMNVKGLLSKNVLYLMVVNMPSQEELEAARQNIRS